MIVLVTGTIVPSLEQKHLALVNGNERENQYREALKILLQCKRINGIVFCDNSEFVFRWEEERMLADSLNKQLELMSFDGDTDAVMKHGKGYGEGRIIEYALEHSELLNQKDKGFFKLTGRLVVSNLDAIARSIDENRNYFNPMYINPMKHMTDTRFYYVLKEDYRSNLLKVYHQVDDNDKKTYLESIFHKCIGDTYLKYKNMPIYPIFEGQSGTSGRQYKLSRIRYGIKNILSRYNMLKA